MANFNFSEMRSLNNAVKIVLGIKVTCFLIISGVESGFDIYQSIKFDKCIEAIASEMKAKNLRNHDAKAIHYCEGGNLISLDD